MPGTLPCPNPTCSHVFSPQDVRGVTSLTCPRCGTVFRFRAGAAPAPPPPRKAAPPVAAPPAPPRAVPVARPVPAEPAPDVFVPPPEPDRSSHGIRSAARRKRTGRRWFPVALALGLLFVAAGVTAWVYREAWLGRGPNDEDAAAIQSLPMNYRFRPPPAPWTEEKGVVRELGASFAMRRTEPNAWLAVVVKDYKDRNPRDDEMEREAVARLRKLFKKGMEYEHRDDDAFAGLDARRFVFTAENSNHVSQSGECLMTAYNGIAYWFFGWTPSAADESVLADVQQQWRDARQGFTLLKEREGWVGKQPEMVEAEGKSASYHLTYTKGLWERDDDRDADLLLQGHDPDKPEEAVRRAWVRVFVRPAAGDAKSAMAAARAFVQEREKRLYPEVKLDAVPEAGKGGLADGAVELGKVKAQLLRLRVQTAENAENDKSFFALAVIRRPAYTLVVVCECAWKHRDLWEPRFGPVLHSLRIDRK
jgi:hypothetical protein